MTTPTEQEVHKAVADYLDSLGLIWMHPPMGGWRSSTEAAIMHGMGARAGWPDILIFSPPPDWPSKVGTAIELKRASRSQSAVTENQQLRLEQLQECQWKIYIAYGLDEALQAVDHAGYVNNKS